MTVRRIELTEALRAHTPAGGADYASAFELDHPSAERHTPRDWARACFEQAPAGIRGFLVFGWRFGLGLRLGPRTGEQHVLGWPIAEDGEDSVTLRADSWLLAASNVVTVEAERVVWTTFVHYTNPAARPIWSVVARIHHRAIPFLLRRASRRLRG